MAWRINRGVQDGQHPVAHQMRRHAEAHPCDAQNPAEVPERYWRDLPREFRAAFWCCPDGTEHLVLTRSGDVPPPKQTARNWQWLLWPPGTKPSLELRTEGAHRWFTHTPGQPPTKVVVDASEGPQSTKPDLAWDDATGKVIDRNTGLPAYPKESAGSA